MELRSPYDGDALSMNVVEPQDELGELIMCSKKDKIIGPRIDGTYGDYMNLMKQKHRDNGQIIEDGAEGDSVIVINSIDGAEHLKSKKTITSIISFSSIMFTSKWVQSKAVFSGSSRNILTWQQIQGTESAELMMPAVEHYLTSKQVLREKSTNQN